MSVLRTWFWSGCRGGGARSGRQQSNRSYWSFASNVAFFSFHFSLFLQPCFKKKRQENCGDDHVDGRRFAPCAAVLVLTLWTQLYPHSRFSLFFSCNLIFSEHCPCCFRLKGPRINANELVVTTLPPHPPAVFTQHVKGNIDWKTAVVSFSSV